MKVTTAPAAKDTALGNVKVFSKNTIPVVSRLPVCVESSCCVAKLAGFSQRTPWPPTVEEKARAQTSSSRPPPPGPRLQVQSDKRGMFH